METIDTTEMFYKKDEESIFIRHMMNIHSSLRHYQKESFYKELLRHAQSR